MMMTSGMILSDSKHRSVSHWAYRVDPSPEDRGESCHIRYRRTTKRGQGGPTESAESSSLCQSSQQRSNFNVPTVATYIVALPYNGHFVPMPTV